jgi:hypothetical protein
LQQARFAWLETDAQSGLSVVVLVVVVVVLVVVVFVMLAESLPLEESCSKMYLEIYKPMMAVEV